MRNDLLGQVSLCMVLAIVFPQFTISIRLHDTERINPIKLIFRSSLQQAIQFDGQLQQMYKLSRKSCFLQLLSYLDYQQVLVILHRSSKCFRQRLTHKYKFIKYFCEDEANQHNITSLQLFFRWQDPEQVLFVNDWKFNRKLIKNLEGRVDLLISLDEPLATCFSEFSLRQANKLRIVKIQITGDYMIYEKNQKVIQDRIRTYFGPLQVNPEIQLVSLFHKYNPNIYLNHRVELLEICCNQKFILSIQCLKMVKVLKLHINYETFYPEFEDLNFDYQSTKFIMAFSNQGFEYFNKTLNAYPKLYEDQCCQIDITQNGPIKRVKILLEILHAWLKSRKFQNKINLKLEKLSTWAFTYDEFSNLVSLLNQIQLTHGELFKILTLDNHFVKNNAKGGFPVLENLLVDQFSWEQSINRQNVNISMFILSNFIIKEKLYFQIFKDTLIEKCERMIACPRELVISLLDYGSYISKTAWETIVVNILGSMVPSDRISVLNIKLNKKQIELKDKENLRRIYAFIKQCPSLQRVHIPYTNDIEILELFKNLIIEHGKKWKFLHLIYAKEMKTEDQAQVQAAIEELFSYIYNNMKELRNLDIDLPHEGFSQYQDKYQMELQTRTLPLQVKLSLINGSEYTVFTMSPKNKRIFMQD
ncbi:hypothetical protein FGO68_gene15259 [Halteria grandinella]|uniref:Uncharacterized protein n=1 Tax=Halteria grandinella TaxID=5974 RepID=A0A8J8NWF1_HALGN|nr:hypothetical protein FGO68_gene15259 [Halteria grandinella]